nr:hypothetical protein [Allomuricauda sp.]
MPRTKQSPRNDSGGRCNKTLLPTKTVDEDENGKKKRKLNDDGRSGVDILYQTREGGGVKFLTAPLLQMHEIVFKATAPEYFNTKVSFTKDGDTEFEAVAVYDLKEKEDIHKTYEFFILCLYWGMKTTREVHDDIEELLYDGEGNRFLMRLIYLADLYQVKWLVSVLLKTWIYHIVENGPETDEVFNNHARDLFTFVFTHEYMEHFNDLLFWFTYNQSALSDLSELLIKTGDTKLLLAIFCRIGAPHCSDEDCKSNVHCYVQERTIKISRQGGFIRRYM